jgi:hypothetical protein
VAQALLPIAILSPLRQGNTPPKSQLNASPWTCQRLGVYRYARGKLLHRLLVGARQLRIARDSRLIETAAS